MMMSSRFNADLAVMSNIEKSLLLQRVFVVNELGQSVKRTLSIVVTGQQSVMADLTSCNDVTASANLTSDTDLSTGANLASDSDMDTGANLTAYSNMAISTDSSANVNMASSTDVSAKAGTYISTNADLTSSSDAYFDTTDAVMALVLQLLENSNFVAAKAVDKHRQMGHRTTVVVANAFRYLYRSSCFGFDFHVLFEAFVDS